jgi:acyl-CoA dehydrogenase
MLDAITPPREVRVDGTLPQSIQDTLRRLDDFIAEQITPLQLVDDNIRFFDHRREWARTDVENGGIPRVEWTRLLGEMRRRADAAGWWRLALPTELGGSACGNLEMAAIREHLANRPLGLHNDLQSEMSVVANNPSALLLHVYGTADQRQEFLEPVTSGEQVIAFGLTEPDAGSDATRLGTTATRVPSGWRISGRKRWNSLLHLASHDLIFARTGGTAGQAAGITAFLVPVTAPGFAVDFFWWTFNMPTDHAEVTLTDVFVPDSAILGEEGYALGITQIFVHENRIRQAAASLGAGQFCVDEAVAYSMSRSVWNKPLAVNQAVQFPLVELHSELAMLRLLIRYTAEQLDQQGALSVSHLVAMCNYRANRAVCEAADRAIQICGGVGYSRHMPFEHIYRHHRRYRITEGAEEIQMRKVAKQLFGFNGS